MNRISMVAAGIGLITTGVGVAVLLDPGFARTLEATALFALVEQPYVITSAVALLALAGAFGVGMQSLLFPTTRVDMPVVEKFTTTEPPGDEFELALAELAGRRGRAARPVDHAEHIRKRLHEDAVRTIIRVHGCEPETAREWVANGTWTEDRYAAAFVGESAAGPAWWQRLRDRLVRADPFERAAIRTADEIAGYTRRETGNSAPEAEGERK